MVGLASFTSPSSIHVPNNARMLPIGYQRSIVLSHPNLGGILRSPKSCVDVARSRKFHVEPLYDFEVAHPAPPIDINLKRIIDENLID